MISPEQQRNDVLTRLSRAVVLLEESMDSRLVAGAGSNIGYAITGARDSTGVAAVLGGLVVRKNAVRAAGACGFGTDAEIARIVLTATKFDPEMRCAATIRHSDAVRRVLEDMFLECCTIDRRVQSPGVNTMDWGRGLLLQGWRPGSDRRSGHLKRVRSHPPVWREPCGCRGEYYYVVEPHYTYRTLRNISWE